MIIKHEPDEIENFLIDASNYKGSCEAVYFPESEADITGILRECSANKTRVTIAGNGTGLTGARVPEGGIVIALEKMNKILELNTTEKYVVVEPGVILKDLQDYVESKCLFYPPDPTERNCFIGATVATNASGARTFKYGPTRDYVLGLRIVLADGEVINLNRGDFKADKYDVLIITESGKILSFTLPRYNMPVTKNASGYYCKENMDPIDLFIGSEGTLGVISRLKLKLIDYPEKILSSVVFFTGEKDAFNFIDEARNLSKRNAALTEIDEKAGPKNIISARGLEFFDSRALRFLSADNPQIPKEAGAAVWFEQEIDSDEEKIIERWTELINKWNGMEDYVWLAVDKNEQEKFKDFRHSISWKVNEYVTQRGFRKVGTDTAVPEEKFREYYYSVKSEVEMAGLDYVVYGHIGDSHMHLNMLPNNQFEYETARRIYGIICERAVEMGGTVSAEHGIGKSKRDYLLKMYGEEVIKKMAALKLVFDPERILGIGNIFNEEYLD